MKTDKNQICVYTFIRLVYDICKLQGCKCWFGKHVIACVPVAWVHCLIALLSIQPVVGNL